MRISARADYAVRAVLELAVRQGGGDPVKAESIAAAQDIPHKFLEGILGDLRRAGVVDSRRGGGGGYRLARAAEEITVADVIRAVDGPIVSVRGVRPTGLSYAGSAEPLLPLWIALRANVRRILEGVTVADIAADALPEPVRALAAEPAAWENP
ncbi:Rrf2 family transcriptional regulator [Streptomyces longwoodensis]|jgi:Rrf2 family protein|uniref:Rrf2 family transcriptional regulator n=1 Tax=Streptomyces lasalocidi TaxID=324833 RepID=A0A4U5WFG9_STRLS|nr:MULTISPECIES: Rrf2 family transcriptional regulator [Streptomyces]MCX4998459.1 Rrf2 family transcriptional regulator [Streptomyces longwoodensis]TKT00617.1 Rrf2 family transcriptional regulator [Streptomyces lasalocidi]WRY88426.1 Rrf2 family transcriptional regulator [Streptomyces longwoodensis]WTI47281.1 Rrf2 family transcriptional regulator [Streptomyces longwoodensis]WUC60027.1 Rrf2 family transcriptional regulator [Streptomyces longwoodensis]